MIRIFFKIVNNILMIILVLALAYHFRGDIENAISVVQKKYLPCKEPVYYSLGSFDEKFGISKDAFLADIKAAEDVWEGPSGLNLFEYKENAKLKVNLVYDSRQEATVALKSIDGVLKEDQSTYDKLKTEYDNLKKTFESAKADFEKFVDAFDLKQAEYNKEVANWNKKGGAPKGVYEELEQERVELAGEANKISQMQIDINNKVRSLNTAASALNQIANKLNLNVAKYNTIGSSNGEEFNEGIYHIGPEGEWIDIYQYENKTSLVRVLAHELGHALGIDHVEDAEAIMYRLNDGPSAKATEADLGALDALCTKKAI